MAKLFVIAGHGAGDPGACSDGYSEADLVRKLASKLKSRGGADVQVGDTSVNWYKSDYISKGKCPKGVPVIELHMDSASGSAKGGHVIIKKGLAADKYDLALQKFIASFFPGRSVTLDKRSNLANVNRAYKMGVNYRLVECGFISNDGDRTKFINQMDTLADGILSAFDIKGGSSSSGTSGSSSSSVKSYTVTVTDSALNIRKGPGTNYAVAGVIKDKGTYTIVAESEGKGASKWGKLKSGAGWISLDFTKKVSGVTVKTEDKAVYRIYNEFNGDHLLTTSSSEAQKAADSGCKYEGVAWHEGTGDEIRRLYNPNTGEHFYTKGEAEIKNLVSLGWKDEGVGFHEGTKYDVYRLYNPNSGFHHYAKTTNERDSLIKLGWKSEGVAFKVD